MDSNAVEQLVAITGVDEVTARHLLEASGGDLSVAVDLHLGGNAPQSNEEGEIIIDEQSDEYRAPIAKSSGILVEESFHASYEPRRRRTNTGSVFDKHRDFKAETEAQRRRLQGLKTEDDSKRNTLESLFRPPTEIIHTGGFESAKAEAVRRGVWLLVNVQKVDEFACQTLNRDVWKQPAVRDIVANNFVLWQIYHDSADGVRFNAYYPVNGYPFLAILDPRTAQLVTSVKTADPVAFCDMMTTFLTDNPCPSPSMSDSQPSTSKASLTRPPIAPKKRRGSPMEADSGSKVLKTESPAYPEQATIRDDTWKQYINKDGAEIGLLLRYPDGKREKIAMNDSSFVKAILLYSEHVGYSPEEYELVLNYPKRVINTFHSTLTLKQAGFNQQETVFIDKK